MIIKLIKIYQLWSQTKPTRCRYVPTCSHYSLESIERFGIWKGLFLSSKRILRCNPLGSHGYDRVPQS